LPPGVVEGEEAREQRLTELRHGDEEKQEAGRWGCGGSGEATRAVPIVARTFW